MARYNLVVILIYALMVNSLLPAFAMASADSEGELISICSPEGPMVIKTADGKAKTGKNCQFCTSIDTKVKPLEVPVLDLVEHKAEARVQKFILKKLAADLSFLSTVHKHAPPVF